MEQTKNEQANPPVGFSRAFRQLISRWLLGALVVVGIQFIMALVVVIATSTEISWGQISYRIALMGGVMAYILIALGCLIASGKSIWTAVLVALLVVRTMFFHVPITIASSWLPGVFASTVVMIGVLAAAYLVRDIYASRNADNFIPTFTWPARMAMVTIVLLAVALNSQTLHDRLYPML